MNESVEWNVVRILNVALLKSSQSNNPDTAPALAWGIMWVLPKIMVPQNGWFIRENPIKMDDLGIPLFLETTMYQVLQVVTSFGPIAVAPVCASVSWGLTVPFVTWQFVIAWRLCTLGPQADRPGRNKKVDWFVQGGFLPIINGVINPINGLIDGQLGVITPISRVISPYL